MLPPVSVHADVEPLVALTLNVSLFMVLDVLPKIEAVCGLGNNSNERAGS